MLGIEIIREEPKKVEEDLRKRDEEEKIEQVEKIRKKIKIGEN